ncbi:MAG TPA: bifunctional protein-serine/threonine kinase/phosphatase [Sulfurovum sp.]|jgi:serine/threonine protein phosphatase PrpC/predicted Ser/Thr protein kinase|nr:MAG: protein kinase [Sulfurovum sp. 35-42-20]OYY55777.1 MAG: protein kinase [Sulfurovum sp. 28-43-6]OYZ25578.1 MAG: protein kinase [Sulfurovum sp. 16-42-52]OYZ49589.1 MAG: protein kinase [Sulfurovum sp. 24-42-9]OZA45566.1 MAG: protein kinase [Sulfurovum sp. 17-42-90]OZA59608.1 MAG: protein kinase [Sulfurovum sp. 39-42-12]HQR74658.1 bifunctional protein-serine/threonine kinase/phosphatase [Sulfurovum sp.]
MNHQLKLCIGQYSHKGRKEINQDFHDVCLPQGSLLHTKGIALAMADGISSSKVSQEASKTAVNSFLEDYFSTSEAWSVKKSAQSVIRALNSWIYAQNRQNLYHLDKDSGYVCTFSALILKSTTAHIFHIGDIRIYRLRNTVLEQLTDDHRVYISKEKSYLGRAFGIDSDVRIDYDALRLELDDIYIVMSDGVYEHTDFEWLLERLHTQKEDYPALAQQIVQHAYDRGSPDNLSVQLVKIDRLPQYHTEEEHPFLVVKPFPPSLEARMTIDGYTIVRPLSITSRSHVFLATDEATHTAVVIKTPSQDVKEDKAYLERLLLEEWITRRLNNAHIVKSFQQSRERNSLYTVMEYIEGQTLAQWMTDNPNPDLEEVRGIVEQIAKGLLALHRQEMIHQDLRPQNIMIDKTGTVKIIDFGSTHVSGLSEMNALIEPHTLLGTAAYTAPEYFLGDVGTFRSDLFSLAVITYQMLSGKLPYGTHVARSKTPAAQKKLRYRSLYVENMHIPFWIDETLKKALSVKPNKRYQELSEFLYDLRHPNQKFLNKAKLHYYEANPLVFWKTLSFILFCLVLFLLFK